MSKPRTSKKPSKPKSFEEGYADIFNPTNLRNGPLVLKDGTSIEWPRGWTQADADTWRKARRLLRPE